MLILLVQRLRKTAAGKFGSGVDGLVLVADISVNGGNHNYDTVIPLYHVHDCMFGKSKHGPAVCIHDLVIIFHRGLNQRFHLSDAHVVKIPF